MPAALPGASVPVALGEMRNHRRSMTMSAALIALGVGTTVSIPTPAAAQQQPTTAIRMPAPSKEEDPGVLMQYLALVVIAAAAVGANLIPSKRGHQD